MRRGCDDGGLCDAPESAGFTVPNDELVRGALIHLGSNMWRDVYTNVKPKKPNWDDKVRVDYLRAEDALRLAFNH